MLRKTIYGAKPLTRPNEKVSSGSRVSEAGLFLTGDMPPRLNTGLQKQREDFGYQCMSLNTGQKVALLGDDRVYFYLPAMLFSFLHSLYNRPSCKYRPGQMIKTRRYPGVISTRCRRYRKTCYT